MSLHESIRQFCAQIGKAPLLVQGAGGNVSWKEKDVLWIKASGTWLADAVDKDIFVPVKLQHLTHALKSQDYSVIPQTVENTPLKPSIETLLHALMPHSIVVHLHAVEVLAHLVREDFKLSNYPTFDTSLNARAVEYFKPGADLAKAIAEQLDEALDTRVIFLKNHGVIIGGESIQEINKILDYLTTFFASPCALPKVLKAPPPLCLTNGVNFNSASDSKLHELSLDPALVSRLENNWVLYPDHVIFLGSQPRLFQNMENAKKELEESDNPPDVIFIQGVGTFTSESISRAKTAQLICYYDVIKRQNNDVLLSTLTDAEIAELVDWDAEKHRMKLAK
ncbi:class II aldolase/adducin family protein [Pseudomonas sp. FP1740]|uniref:class II aldolase/adducin family protein n=1 Tax=Pseudomonas sp. FP1740 TaxID=2954078 RepID=UPI00273499CE|nr:class II aldolase/adducin family protein [Pseudomonas sp. FP1740]WLG43460.1 class II aldolase/adducin family protein [Pseudomonas sp. FP1740]